MSVRERFVHRDRMQEHHHGMRWKTLEEGIQQLREVAVLEVLFGRSRQHDNDPDKVRCTGQMLWNLATLGPSQYATFIATIHPDNNRETVGSVANKLRNYESMISGPMQAHVSAVAKELRERMEEGEAQENRVYWTVWIRWPGTSEPQKYEALVDTGSQCTLIPSEYVGTEPISIAGVTGGSQELTLLEAEVSLTGKEWQKHPIVTGSGAPCILGIDFLRNGYYKDSKGLRWAFGIAAVEAEGIKKLNSLPGLSENPSAVGLLNVEEQRVPVATSTVHRRQYRTNRDAVIPIHKMIWELESQGVVSKTHSPFNSPIWPVRKSDGERRLTVDYRALNEVTPPLSAAVPDMLELQYELESKAAKWYATIDIANAFFSIPLAAECRPQFAFTWRGVQYTWNRLPQGWKHSPTICHGLIQAALEKGEAPEHLQYIDDIIVWGNTAMEVFEKGEKIIQILLKAGFAIKQSKVKGPAREIQFLGVKWQDGRQQIPTEVINKITAMSPPTSKKETQAFLGAIGFWRMHIPEYRQIVSPLYLVTRKKNDFHWGPEQQQAFAQIKQEIAHAVALGPVRTGPDVKNMLYSAAGNNGLSWSLWQKVPGETRGQPLGFWSRSYRGSEANYTPTEKESLAAYEGVQAASEVAQATEGEGGSSQLAELKAVQLALDIAEREKWPKLYLYTDSWMVANALWGWLDRWKKANWQRRGKPIWAADEWKDIATRVEKLPVKVLHVDAHVPKSRANEEHQNNEQIDYITLPQTHQGKRYVLTMVEATTGWLETYPVPHATARNTILGLEKQILWRHGTPERIESDNGTHFKNSLINTWAREHGIEWVYHIPYHAPAAGKVERCNGLLKTTLKALGGGTFKNWEINLAKATWLVNTRGSTNQVGPAQSEPLRTRDGDKVPVVHMRRMLGKLFGLILPPAKTIPLLGLFLLRDLAAHGNRFPDPLYYYPPQILHIDSVILLLMIPIGILQRPLGVC
ncbi:hypothetical protein DUI87_00858 [Hirundo rustica rustica]|uniref:ribonuclease H n=1 Tax=Hirundo rustica rustica TaxID=333673 RepID=A0A3M0L338_HIRRU|nr:hypothetical protein DUI87_00858 [Hirundo rustica rustica]